MVAVGQFRFGGFESSSGLLVLFVGDAVQGGGGGIAVGAGRQGQAPKECMTVRLDIGNPGRVRAVG
jgi:hypothetical protein